MDECIYRSSEECSPTLSKDKYTRSLGNTQEELELCAQSESYIIIGITGIWWENSHDKKTSMGGYKLFWKDNKGRRRGGVAVCVKEI